LDDLAFNAESGDRRRGVCKGFSSASRTAFMRWLGEIDTSAKAFTMCLSLPAEFLDVTHEQLAAAFKIMARRFASVRRFRKVAAAWKREQQKRGALHWHMVLWGLQCPSLEAEVRDWMVSTWLDVLAPHFAPEAIERMRKVHAHDRNWIELKGHNWACYVAKYLGKDLDAEASAVPGRWWGSWNKKAVPRVDPQEVELPGPVADDLARAFSKHRQKKVVAAINRSVGAALPIGSFCEFAPVLDYDFDNNRPVYGPPVSMSSWEVQRLRMGYVANGRNPEVARFLLATVREAERLAGRKFVGRWRPETSSGVPIPETASMVVIGSALPPLALRVIINSCKNRGFPVPPLVSLNEKKTQVSAACLDHVASVRSSRLSDAHCLRSAGPSPQQASLPLGPECFGPGTSDLLRSRRNSQSTLKRRRLGAAHAGVAEG
jgi:hypothetical protein